MFMYLFIWWVSQALSQNKPFQVDIGTFWYKNFHDQLTAHVCPYLFYIVLISHNKSLNYIYFQKLWYKITAIN